LSGEGNAEWIGRRDYGDDGFAIVAAFHNWERSIVVGADV
jgi:hypothetical protein